MVVPRDRVKQPVTADDVITLLATKFRKWQLPCPEDVHFVEALPKTTVGKLDKKAIRKLLIENK
jgi:fatty-acyl-CoA synthase